MIHFHEYWVPIRKIMNFFPIIFFSALFFSSPLVCMQQLPLIIVSTATAHSQITLITSITVLSVVATTESVLFKLDAVGYLFIAISLTHSEHSHLIQN